MLAAHAGKPRVRASLLADRWSDLVLENVIRPAPAEILHVAARLLGRAPSPRGREARRGGIFDPSGVERIVRTHVPFDRIADHMRAGHVAALSISTTHVASGRTVVFVQRTEGDVPPWGTDPTMVARSTSIRAEHVLASAAVPLLFPAVNIDGQFYSRRRTAPERPAWRSPARRLGAGGLIVVSPRYIRDESPSPALAEAREQQSPDPLFVVGKAMNALLLDRIENDIDRLRGAERTFSRRVRVASAPGFAQALNEELGRAIHRHGLRPLDIVYVRASPRTSRRAGRGIRSVACVRQAGGRLPATSLPSSRGRRERSRSAVVRPLRRRVRRTSHGDRAQRRARKTRGAGALLRKTWF